MGRCVGDVDTFLARCLGERPHRWHGGALDGLLSLDDVDSLITGAGLRRPSIRLVRDGQVLEPRTWTRRARTGQMWIDDLVHPGKVVEHFADGATVVLQSLHRWWPPLTAFCRQLEVELGHPVQANAYLTPAGAAGLTPHHDTHDVFILQVHGEKHWVLREPAVVAPIAAQRSDHAAAASRPVHGEEELRPGDCLYLPRGFVHSARAQQGVSLHITIGLLATTAHDLLRQIVDAAADEDPTFRRSMPAGFGTDRSVAVEALRQVAGELTRWLEAFDPAPLAQAAVEAFVGRRPPLLRHHLIEVTELERVDDATEVVLRPGTVWALACDAGSGRVTVTLGDRRLDLPAAVEPPLRLLLDGAPHRVGELAPLLDDHGRLVLVRRLLREGLLGRHRTAGEP